MSNNIENLEKLTKELEDRDLEIRSLLKFLETILDSVNDAIIIHDVNGKIREVSWKAIKLFEKSKEELIGSELLSYFYGHSKQDLEGCWLDLVSKSKNSCQHKQLALVKDRVIKLSVYSVRIEHEGRNLVLSVLTDISELMEALDLIEEIDVIFKKTIDDMSDPVLITGDKLDPEPLIVYVNPAFEQHTDYSKEELIGKNPIVMRHEESDLDTAKLKQELKEKGFWCGIVTNKKKDGSMFKAKLEIYPVFTKDKVINYVGIYSPTESVDL